MFIVGIRNIIKEFNETIEYGGYTQAEIFGDTFGFIIIPLAVFIMYLFGIFDHIVFI